MSRKLHTLRWLKRAALIALGLSAGTESWAFNIDIQANGYQGRYTIDGVSHQGDQALDLAAGSYHFDNGYGGFTFTVDSGGGVSSNKPGTATGSPGTLSLNTSSVALDANGYVGGLRGNLTNGFVSFSGASQDFIVIRGLRHSFDNGSGSAFSFDVDDLGNVTPVTGTASFGLGADAQTLVLNTGTLHYNPQDYGGVFRSNFVNGFFSGAQDFTLIRGMTWNINRGLVGPNVDLYFTVDPNGLIDSLNAIAATGLGSELQLNTVAVHVDPDNYLGQFRTGGYSALQGIQDLVMVQGLGNTIQAEGLQKGLFTPYADGVDPGNLLINIAGTDYTFRFSTVPLPGALALFGLGLLMLRLRRTQR